MRDVIYEMSSKALGMTCVVDRDDDTLLGIITDGDLRRHMERGGEILDLTAGDVMTRDPVTVARATLAAEALNIMEQRKITSLVVVEDGPPTRVAGVRAPARSVANGDVLSDETGDAVIEDIDAARASRLILFDVDGVLTDGKILLHADGTESKQFDIKDGTGIVWAQRARADGRLPVGAHRRRRPRSARRSSASRSSIRASPSKLETYEQIADSLMLDDDQVAYMGDDILDLPVLARVGLSAAPADAVDEVRSRVHWVSRGPRRRTARRAS